MKSGGLCLADDLSEAAEDEAETPLAGALRPSAADEFSGFSSVGEDFFFLKMFILDWKVK